MSDSRKIISTCHDVRAELTINHSEACIYFKCLKCLMPCTVYPSRERYVSIIKYINPLSDIVKYDQLYPISLTDLIRYMDGYASIESQDYEKELSELKKENKALKNIQAWTDVILDDKNKKLNELEYKVFGYQQALTALKRRIDLAPDEQLPECKRIINEVFPLDKKQ